MTYWAEYDKTVDVKSLEEIFTENNISCDFNEDKTVLSFSFSKREIDNETIEGTYGTIWSESWRYSFGNYKSDVCIELDQNVFPHVKKGEGKEKLYAYKPYLNNSMDYVTTLIYNATGLWPAMKKYEIEDGTQ